ncbi:MAG: SUMF1/EgtB/PvdO family nonheme iron enzyme [Lentisphaeria bacterium]|nr:SUMF1/EgtB/PvdO family nonheme iron enzyme [Lentisphaeria bacterium]
MEPGNYNVTQIDSRERIRNLYFQPGDIIADRYEFVRELGRGGMGSVLLCRDTVASNREMALKTVPDILRNNEEAVAALRQEYDNMYNLTHDGIIAVRNLVHDEFRYYVVMDYAEGETLEAYLKSHPKPGLAVTLEVVRHLAEALDYAHGKNMVHRDVKPGNVMIQIDGATVKSVKLLDFGLGIQIRESFSRTTGSMATSGTPAYKSPEQWSPKQYGKASAKSDQYSLAVLAYEMLDGHYPFYEYDLDTFRDGVLNDEPALLDDQPEYVSNVLLKALSKRSQDRFESCMAFAMALAGTGTQPSQQTPAPNIALQATGNQYSTNVFKPSANNNITLKLADGVELELVKISAGKFMMGAPDSKTRREVTLTTDYWIGKYPVTQAQYEAVLKQNPSYFKGKDNPVENISWNEAMQFCQMLNMRISSQIPGGYYFNLPTEAQWEYAGRAGTTTSLNNGEEMIVLPDGSSPNLDELGWYCKNSQMTTHPVGQKKPNAWGLYDMHGNVQEYCFDRYHENYDETIDPTGWFEGDDIVKGGNFATEANQSRIDSRTICKKQEFGFRLALVSIQQKQRHKREYDFQKNKAEIAETKKKIKETKAELARYSYLDFFGTIWTAIPCFFIIGGICGLCKGDVGFGLVMILIGIPLPALVLWSIYDGKRKLKNKKNELENQLDILLKQYPE